MPRKDKDARLAYQREWYAREENRKRTIAAVAKRKWTAYAGTCKNCGGPTIGQSKGQAAEFCGKPECKSAQRKLNREVFVAAGKRSVTKPRKKTVIKQKKVVNVEELSDTY